MSQNEDANETTPAAPAVDVAPADVEASDTVSTPFAHDPEPASASAPAMSTTSVVNPSEPAFVGEVVVPRSAVGLVSHAMGGEEETAPLIMAPHPFEIIGKSGETIRKLCSFSQTRIQFKPDEDPTSETRCATISADSLDKIEKATDLIKELVERDSQRMGGPNGPHEIAHIPVAAGKAGLVIGKSGVTIKGMCTQTGAYIELSREENIDNPAEKIFIVKGTKEQIEQVKQLIDDKIAHASDLPQSRSSSRSSFVPMTNYGSPGYGAQNLYGMGSYDYRGGNSGYRSAGIPYAMTPTIIPGMMPMGGAQPYMQSAGPTPTINPITGKLDYSLQWIDYYR